MRFGKIWYRDIFLKCDHLALGPNICNENEQSKQISKNIYGAARIYDWSFGVLNANLFISLLLSSYKYTTLIIIIIIIIRQFIRRRNMSVKSLQGRIGLYM